MDKKVLYFIQGYLSKYATDTTSKNKKNNKEDLLNERLMTIDEAIEHAEEKADSLGKGCPCGDNHRQLANWLKELKVLKS